MLAAREKLEREIDLVTIIKSRRYTALALKALLPHKKRLELKSKSNFFQINTDGIPFADQRKKGSLDDYSDDCSQIEDNYDGRRIEIPKIISANATIDIRDIESSNSSNTVSPRVKFEPLRLPLPEMPAYNSLAQLCNTS